MQRLAREGQLVAYQHTGFWRPVVERLVEEIFKAKGQADAKHRGVVFDGECLELRTPPDGGRVMILRWERG